ncbi:hypothetical protein [Acinetobacter sp.]|jgi:hypothetical protein|uniref:hypothetical protein n=1 Tax=Acinetobacter sp. TaxID=472 RepID=UPI00333EBE5C
MYYLFFLAALLMSAELKAQSPLDQPFLQSGAVDEQFNIVNLKLYNELVKVINHNFKNIPTNQSDRDFIVSRIMLISNGLWIESDLKDIKSIEDLTKKFDQQKYQRLIKQNICKKDDLLESEVFKKTTGGNFIYQINNAEGDFLKSFTVNYRECL